MGLFYDIFGSGKKKRCTECGCVLIPDVEADICESCVYNMLADSE